MTPSNTPIQRSWTRHVQAWRGGDGLPSGELPGLPDQPVERLAFHLLHAGLLDPADLRRARWLARDVSESVLVLLMLARSRRGHGSSLAADLASDLETAATLALPGLPGTALEALPERLASDRTALAATLAEAVDRAAREGASSGRLVRADASGEGVLLSFARSHDAQSLLAERLLDRFRQDARPPEPDPRLLDAVCDRAPALHPAQKQAVRACLVRRTALVSGGPGTGKTTVVARVLEALEASDPAFRRESTALCAPTGRAKARLQESIAAALPAWGAPSAFTLHSLLGPRPDGGFRHDAGNPLPWSTVVVDEASMIDLALFAALLDALHPDTRLLLLGDPDQLPSVESGAVFGDLVATLAGRDLPGARHERLTHTHRNAGAIRALADQTRDGVSDSVIAGPVCPARPDARGVDVLRNDAPGTVRWFDASVEETLDLWWTVHPPGDGRLHEDPARSRILCVTHQGAAGRERVNELGDALLRRMGRETGRPEAAGRPVALGRNLPALDLWNGDLGTLVASDGDTLHVAFPKGDGLRLLAPERLEGLEAAWAITVHKSQGSEFDHVLLLLPDDDTPLLVRQILYTGLTRARRTLWIRGSKDLWARGCARREHRVSRLPGLLER